MRETSDDIGKAILDAAPDAIVVADQSGRIVLVNAQTERTFGYTRDELLGRSVDILVPERYREGHTSHRTAYTEAASPRPIGMGRELFGLRKDGSEFPVEISLSPIPTRQGLLIASAIRDITERKAAQAERARLVQERAAHAEANRIKDEFLATLSHELRTPLNAILGWARLLDGGALDADAAARAVATIERNARVQAQLVDDLLDVSRIVSGKLRLDVAAMDLTEVADAAVEVTRPAADAKGIQLTARYESRPLLLTGDADRLQQVIWNLLSNAIKFTPAHGRVELHVRSLADHAEIVVRDTGAGIPASFLPHVFDRFRQLDSGTTRAHGGLGLGLAIARSIVELHGGRIEAASSGQGLGATFRVELPTERVARPGTGPTTSAAEELAGATLLVVKDQEDERELLRVIFEHAGAQVRTAASVREARTLLQVAAVDLIVTDIAMPHEDGYALVRHVRDTPSICRIPVVAVTAHARPEDVESALSAGFRDYVSKPIDPAGLLARAAMLVKAERGRG
jgi:PAS domain S-box-containing protein